MKSESPMERHKDFFRAVVELARAHKMDHLTLKFGDSFQMEQPRGGYLSFEGVWREGRHGAAGMMELRWDARASIMERDDSDD